jgi:hypothetical protein
LFPGSHYGSHHADLSGNTTGGKKPAKELILKTDSMYKILIVLTLNIHREQNITMNYQSFIYQLMHKRVALKEY